MTEKNIDYEFIYNKVVSNKGRDGAKFHELTQGWREISTDLIDAAIKAAQRKNVELPGGNLTPIYDVTLISGHANYLVYGEVKGKWFGMLDDGNIVHGYDSRTIESFRIAPDGVLNVANVEDDGVYYYPEAEAVGTVDKLPTTGGAVIADVKVMFADRSLSYPTATYDYNLGFWIGGSEDSQIHIPTDRILAAKVDGKKYLKEELR